jgi:hypothetical protein
MTRLVQPKHVSLREKSAEYTAWMNEYKFCDFKKAVPTRLVRKATGTEYGHGLNKRVPTWFKYLWEVLVIDQPLRMDRDVGTIVEAIGVSSAVTESYKALNKPTYVKIEDETKEARIMMETMRKSQEAASAMA